MKAIRHYWPEMLVMGVVVGVLLNALAPQLTWMNTDSDGAHYTLAAKYLTTAHHMSAPLYLLLGHMFLWLPVYSEAWRMGLMSVLGTLGSCLFIYLVVRHLLAGNAKGRLYACIAVLVFGGSALTVSQSTIVETYTLGTMCGVGAYYFVLYRRWLLASIMLGLGLAIQPFFAFAVWLVLFVALREMRDWKRYGLTIVFFTFYLYIPIVKAVGTDVGMWGNTSASGFFGGTTDMVLMHTGGLSIWDFPKRAVDTMLILLASFGLGIVPLVWQFVKVRRWKYGLLWLVLIPIMYFAVDLSNATYVYCLPGIAFGCVAVGLGLSKLDIRWAVAVCFVAVALLGFNGWYFDVDKHLDPEMSAMKFYNDLGRIPDGQYFMGGGWTWSMVYLYNREEGRGIIPISTDAIVSEQYLAVLGKMGVKYRASTSTSYVTKEGEIALSIAELNDNVWIAKETKPTVYQYEIVPAKGNEAYIGRWIGQEIEPGHWKWKPSNPWKYIAGELEVSEWHHILMSNRNMLHVMCYGLLGYGVYLMFVQMRKRRRKKAL